MSKITLMQGDCIELMKNIPDKSVDMVLCDLPYGSLKSIVVDGWKENNTDISWDDLLPIQDLFNEYNRVLRQNGAIVLFNKEPLTTALRNNNNDDIEYGYTYVWKKNNFANPYLSKKTPLSVCEFIDVYYKKYSNGNEQYDEYRFNLLNAIGVPKREIIEKCGQGLDHFFRNRTKQFVTEDGYNKLIEIYNIDKLDIFISYEELKRVKEKSQRVFNIPNGQKYVSDLLEFAKDSTHYHPTQKPIELLSYLIEIYTNENACVLDNCMGSGSTGVAAKKLNRNFIGIELDEIYFTIAKERIENT